MTHKVAMLKEIPHLSLDGDPSFEPKRTLFLPVDHTQTTIHAIDFVLDQIADSNDLILLAHVRPGFQNTFEIELASPYTPMLYPAKSQQNVDDDDKKESYELLIQLAQKFAKKKIHVKAVALQGDVKKELILKITETRPDLVIIKRHGLGLVKKIFAGSVSEFVIKNSVSPVMVLPK